VYWKEWKPGTETREVYEEIRRLVNSGVSIGKFAKLSILLVSRVITAKK
ncbi:hypothetical protein LCGC14_2508580, partial [marine sediment metagenome]